MSFHKKPATFVENVHLKVENLDRSLKFYQTILGFDILERTSESAKLTTDGETSILSLEQPSDVIPKQGRTSGLYHFAILLPSKTDLANFVVHLAQNQIPIGSSDHQVSLALYFNDPDGNGIEVYCDRDAAEWTWQGDQVVMTVDPLDFDDLLKHATSTTAWQGMPKDTVMGHIHLHVSEIKSAEEFYVKGLGFKVVTRYGGQAIFLSTADYHHHIGVNVWNGVGAPTPPENSVGLSSYTLNYPDEGARQEAINRLKELGAQVKESSNQWVTKDPSGNRIILAV